MEWYPFYPLDFERDTAHLTLEQEAVYRRLIDWYMIHGGAPADDDRAIANITRISTETWAGMAEVIRAFFVSTGTRLQHARCEHELNTQFEQRAKHAKYKAAQRRRKKLKTKETGDRDGQWTVHQMSTDRTGQDNTIQKEERISLSACANDLKPDPQTEQFFALKLLGKEEETEVVEAFVNKHRALGTQRADWQAELRNFAGYWAKNRHRYKQQFNGRAPNGDARQQAFKEVFNEFHQWATGSGEAGHGQDRPGTTALVPAAKGRPGSR